MWLVGYLFNNNGMGTWCWEAAHALAAAGERVALVCSTSVQLPGPTSIEILRIDPPVFAGSLDRVFAPGGMASAHGPRVMRSAIRLVEQRGDHVAHVLLNSTEFFDETLVAPQYVVAWASGVTLREYVSRLMKQTHPSARERVRASLGTIGWWRRDWFAFRHADRVLAVTTPLCDELRSHDVPASLLYPCTHSMGTLASHADDVVRLVTSAADLDDPRKRVLWMLGALEHLSGAHVQLTIVGAASEVVREAADRLPFRVHLTGPLPREQAVAIVRDHDVFLFASTLDDWGYVVTEAMANGLAIVAPNIPPFNEIVAEGGALYSVDDAGDFRSSIFSLVPRISMAREAALARAKKEFSREAFVSSLREIVSK